MSQKKLCVAIAVIFCLCMAGYLFAEEKKSITNSIGMEFVLIPAGSFMMGADKNFEDASDHETPRHPVTISKPFYIGKYEVTQDQWVAVMSSNPSNSKGRTKPVENISYDDTLLFIRKLNEKEGTGKYRLPTEAEWEYTARVGTTTAYSFGDDKNKLGQYAWYQDNSEKETHPVGQLKPNVWGLYDMHGNVWEWVQDWYSEKYYANSPSTNPKGDSSGSHKVLRGGGWATPARSCQSAIRSINLPTDRKSDIGFRLVRSE